MIVRIPLAVLVVTVVLAGCVSTKPDVRSLAVSGTDHFAGTYRGGVFLSTN